MAFAPTYDYMFTIAPNAPYYINRHSMAINGKIQDVDRGDLLRLTKRYNIKSAESFIEKPVDTVWNYSVHGEKTGVSGYWIHVLKEETALRIDY